MKTPWKYREVITRGDKASERRTAHFEAAMSSDARHKYYKPRRYARPGAGAEKSNGNA